MTDVAQPHDRFFKTLLSDPRQAGTLLRERLPKAIAECFSEEPPVLVDGTFVDKELSSHLTDRLYSVQTVQGRRAFLYILIEHKSQAEKRIASNSKCGFRGFAYSWLASFHRLLDPVFE
jgi:predicted transposase YdaD